MKNQKQNCKLRFYIAIVPFSTRVYAYSKYKPILVKHMLTYAKHNNIGIVGP